MNQVSEKGKTPHIFGIRHLSPGGAYHLLRFLDAIKPTAVLIEGLSDANSQIEYFTSPGTTLPIAVLAYTEELPVRTLFSPIAEYSPEYQALNWAKKNKVHAEFIDLPSDVFLKIQYANRTKETPDSEDNDEREDQGCNDESRGEDPTESVYLKWAKLAGEQDHDTYWERNFEHNLNKDAYQLTAYEFGKSLRELTWDSRHEQAETLIREAYMRRRIQDTIKAGHDPEKIVVVTGAYHAAVLNGDYPTMTDEEFENLPRVKSKLTLMPYSFYRLSSRSGYGAGNHAPQYFQLMWQGFVKGDIARLPAEYLAKIVRYMRKNGTPRSAAEVIEGVRLANSLAGIHGDSAPALRDLRDAAMTCLGHGEISIVAEAMAAVEVGTAIGCLPEGVSRTSIQDDFYRELKRLKLEKYRSAVATDLELDLRENRRVKTEDAAYLDLNRSFFLRRLKALAISFQQLKKGNQDSATWSENWVLQWTPEAEIQLVEATLLGETIELAAAYAFKERLDRSEKIAEAAQIIREACECGMPGSMEYARGVLQKLAVDTGAFEEVAHATSELSIVISYGDIRKFDSSHLIPLLQQLFLRGTLLVLDAANCNNTAVNSIVDAIHSMNVVALAHYTLVDEELWLKMLAQLAERDDKNPKLSGFACGILLERNIMDNGKLSEEVSRRLSPGIDADLGAGWFEGLSMRNKYALLTRMTLWVQIAEYVSSLDVEQFKRALVFLRRAFGEFGPGEKRSICENLAEIWGVNQDQVSEIISGDLTEEEQSSIDKLNDFDFGDI